MAAHKAAGEAKGAPCTFVGSKECSSICAAHPAPKSGCKRSILQESRFSTAEEAIGELKKVVTPCARFKIVQGPVHVVLQVIK